MALHLRRWPRPSESDGGPEVERRPRLVLLHGFTQNVDCWGPFADLLAVDHPVDGLDAPGHGSTDPIHDRADLDDAAALVNRHLVDTAAVVIGYSMGGRLALHLALAHPEAVAGLVLIGASPGLEDRQERQRRRQADNDLARRLRAGPLDEFMAAWLAKPLFAGLTTEAAALNARLRNRAEGLAASLEHCGTGAQRPLWSELPTITAPVLLIAGDDDHKFSALARRMAAGLTSAPVTMAQVRGTHAVHLEQPQATADVVRGWLATLPP